ncbi:MAG: hypothetical protein ACK4PR_08625 [Gammaproteobacteria bacterium]
MIARLNTVYINALRTHNNYGVLASKLLDIHAKNINFNSGVLYASNKNIEAEKLLVNSKVELRQGKISAKEIDIEKSGHLSLKGEKKVPEKDSTTTKVPEQDNQHEKFENARKAFGR